MTNYLSDPVLLIVGTLLGFLKYMMIFRLLFEVARVNFYNPLCQAVVKITKPIISPFSFISLRFGGIDLGIVLLIIFIIGLEITFPYFFQNVDLNITHILILSFGLFLKTVLNIFFWLIIIGAIASWFFIYNNNPLFSLINELCNPLYQPIRNLLPSMSGIDFSPIILILLIQLTEMLVVRPIFGLIHYF
tara:strand:- start:213 stop:782 length:570 start_codon:yes stop_codon:yes gene_type:complete